METVAHIQDMFLKMAQDREITGEVGRVLYYFFGKLDFENYIHVAQTEIAETLDLQKSHVSGVVSPNRRNLSRQPKWLID